MNLMNSILLILELLSFLILSVLNVISLTIVFLLLIAFIFKAFIFVPISSIAFIFFFSSFSKKISTTSSISLKFINSVYLKISKLLVKNIIDLSNLLFKFSKLPTFEKHIFSPSLLFISLNILSHDINLIILLSFE